MLTERPVLVLGSDRSSNNAASTGFFKLDHPAYRHDKSSRLEGLRNYITRMPDDLNTSASTQMSHEGPNPVTDPDTEGVEDSCDPDNNAAAGCVDIDAGGYCDATIPSGSDAARISRGRLEGEDPEPAQWEPDTAFETEELIVPEIDGKRLVYARYLTRAYALHAYTLFRT